MAAIATSGGAARAAGDAAERRDDAAADSGGGDQLFITSRGFPDAAGTLAGLFTYHRSATASPAATCRSIPIKDAHDHAGDVLAAVRADRHHRVARRRLQERRSAGTTPPSRRPSRPNEIYPLVPADLSSHRRLIVHGQRLLSAGHAHHQPGAAAHLGRSAARVRRQHPHRSHWKGGQIGFALDRRTANMQCPQTKYSQAELNDNDSRTSKPWVTTLIYHSVADPERLLHRVRGSADLHGELARLHRHPAQHGAATATTATSTTSSSTSAASPARTAASRAPFRTRWGSAPAASPSARAAGMATTCRQAVMPADEKCDGVDNDCNGVVDEGNLCGDGAICDARGLRPPLRRGQRVQVRGRLQVRHRRPAARIRAASACPAATIRSAARYLRRRLRRRHLSARTRSAARQLRRALRRRHLSAAVAFARTAPASRPAATAATAPSAGAAPRRAPRRASASRPVARTRPAPAGQVCVAGHLQGRLRRRHLPRRSGVHDGHVHAGARSPTRARRAARVAPAGS